MWTVGAGSRIIERMSRLYHDGNRQLQDRFPKPDGGIVSVVYPIVFSPGE